MKRTVELRASAYDWFDVLRTVYPFLRRRGVGDLLLFGSHAMALYMDNPLRTKDLDMVSSQYGPLHHSSLREHILHAGIEVRSSTVQTKPLTHGDMTIYTLELRLDGSPFFVEIFDRVLDGKPVSILTPYVQHVKEMGSRDMGALPERCRSSETCLPTTRRHQPVQRHTIEHTHKEERRYHRPIDNRQDHY